jgi:hypothetical protein
MKLNPRTRTGIGISKFIDTVKMNDSLLSFVIGNNC